MMRIGRLPPAWRTSSASGKLCTAYISTPSASSTGTTWATPWP